MSTFLKIMVTLAIPIAVVVASTTAATAQETKATEKAEKFSPAGNWTWEQKFGDSKISSELTIVEKDGKLSGKYKDEDRDLEIKNSKLEDGRFSFRVFPHPEHPEFAINYEGKLSADEIKGTMNYMDHDEAKSVVWTASRVDPMNIAIGKWLLEFDTPDGIALEFKVQVQKKGKGLGVKFVDEKSAKVRNVKFKNGALTFDSHQVYEEQPVSVEWTLEFDGNQASGSLYYMFDNAEGEGELELSGERVN